MSPDPFMLKSAYEGDRKAQYTLYRMCFSALMPICMRFKRNEEEAILILNSAFVKIVRNLHRYSPEEVLFEAWIKRILINTGIDSIRRDKAWKERVYLTDKWETAVPEEHVDWNEADEKFNAQHAQAMLNQLPPVTQQVFSLFAIEGFTHAEISETLGLNINTSKWHVSQARKMLKTMIKTEQKPALD